MTEIDRRTLFGMAGASLVLTGCAGRMEDRPGGIVPAGGHGGSGDRGGEEAGGCQLWGESAHRTRPNSNSEDLRFDPQYVCAVYIRYEDNCRPNIRHAYKALTGDKTDEAIRSTAEYILKALRDDKIPADIRDVRRNFNHFSMNSQQAVVLFIDNDPALIRFNKDMDMENVVRFTAFGGTPPYGNRKPNYAFYNLQQIWMTKGLFASNTAIRMDFWNTDETGALLKIGKDDPQDKWYVYSMNIHLVQAPYEPDEVSVIPIILDPDTGNMGAEP
ncbi:MAG: hypothetical protein QOJ91_3103 [Sphingomonadales bacterium]|jgi:hypothetical protein|nr:hypothetical protein [Sphingomonadales bacterium]